MAYEDLSDEDRKSLGLGQLLRQAKDPAAQEEWKRLAKKINPNLQFPELELTDKFDALTKRQSDWEEKQEERKTEERTARRHEQEARKAEAAGFKVEDIQKLATDMGIGSFDAALEFAQLQRDSAEPTAASYGRGPRGPAEIIPSDWRKMTPAERVRHGQRLAHEGISDMLRRMRTNR